LVTAAYRQSFFPDQHYSEHQVAIASARAGNVIGGGDWSQDRLIPDAIAAFHANKPLKIRNPLATRPWQHVLEPLSGYLVLAQALYRNGPIANGAWNFGPNDDDSRSVKDVIELLISKWKKPAFWEQDGTQHPHEAHFLKLDCSKARQLLGWHSKWSLENALDAIVYWHDAFQRDEDMLAIMQEQIISYSSN
jgi:CDP-glucose 4,6-dehydratase